MIFDRDEKGIWNATGKAVIYRIQVFSSLVQVCATARNRNRGKKVPLWCDMKSTVKAAKMLCERNEKTYLK